MRISPSDLLARRGLACPQLERVGRPVVVFYFVRGEYSRRKPYYFPAAVALLPDAAPEISAARSCWRAMAAACSAAWARTLAKPAGFCARAIWPASELAHRRHSSN